MPNEFRVQWPADRVRRGTFETVACPKFVPWDKVSEHSVRAEMNHNQTLETLHSRGGLDPSELCAVLLERRWEYMGDVEAINKLKELVKAA